MRPSLQFKTILADQGIDECSVLTLWRMVRPFWSLEVSRRAWPSVMASTFAESPLMAAECSSRIRIWNSHQYTVVRGGSKRVPHFYTTRRGHQKRVVTSCVSAVSVQLEKPGAYQRCPGSWDPRYPLPKTKKSADLTHYFSRVATFCALKIQCLAWEGQCQAWIGFLPGKFIINFQESKFWWRKFSHFPQWWIRPWCLRRVQQDKCWIIGNYFTPIILLHFSIISFSLPSDWTFKKIPLYPPGILSVVSDHLSRPRYTGLSGRRPPDMQRSPGRPPAVVVTTWLLVPFWNRFNDTL